LPLGTIVGLSPGDSVRWGPNPLPTKGWSPSPIFGPFRSGSAGDVAEPRGRRRGVAALRCSFVEVSGTYGLWKVTTKQLMIVELIDYYCYTIAYS